jgi:hypothetical protein
MGGYINGFRDLRTTNDEADLDETLEIVENFDEDEFDANIGFDHEEIVDQSQNTSDATNFYPPRQREVLHFDSFIPSTSSAATSF